MRKVHYKVVLDVLLYEDENADGLCAISNGDFSLEEDNLDVIDVSIKSVECTDSR